MFKKLYIPKDSNTYADTLEAYGVAHLIEGIYDNLDIEESINIVDNGVCYQIELGEPITRTFFEKLNYFRVIEYLHKNHNDPLPINIKNYFNYPQQKELKRQRKELYNEIADLKGDDYKKAKFRIEEQINSEGYKKIRDDFDVFAQLISNPYAAYIKLHNNFYANQEHFETLVIEILNRYSTKNNQIPTGFRSLVKEKKINITAKVTMLQLFNPNQGKGLNKAKATGIGVGNLKGNWISETMKISGALNYGMICQAVKVGSSFDMKIFVPAFSETTLGEKIKVLKLFKKSAKGGSPIMLDILNVLKIIEIFLKENTKELRKGRKVKEFLLGLHSVYQKDLGQNKAVVNIGFLQTPDFIDFSHKKEWLYIIDEQKRLMNGIKGLSVTPERGDVVVGLLAYRKFLNASDINEYFKFINWYAAYIMRVLSNKKQTHVVTNKIETLNKIFILMDISLKEIIDNDGFQSVAAAIRKSTVSLQYTPKEQRQFDVQYGLAQKIQNKSSSKEDLIAFVGEFVAKYNSDTARYYEKTQKDNDKVKKHHRANVRDKELASFYELADKVKPKVLGSMLAAYGFALNKKENTSAASE